MHLRKIQRIFSLTLSFYAALTHASVLYVEPSRNSQYRYEPGSIVLSTIKRAMEIIKPGDRVVIRPGIYREPILLPNRPWSKSTPTIIEGQATGLVLIKGSAVVSTWAKVADPFTYRTNWPDEPQQVYWNNQALTQVGGTVFGGYPLRTGHPLAHLHANQGGIWPGRIALNTGLQPNSFLYDTVEHQLTIRLSAAFQPTDTIEVSVLRNLLLADNVEGLTVRNIHFEHANSSLLGYTSAVQINGNHVRLESIHIARADDSGLGLAGDDNQISSSSSNQCGRLGMHVRGRRALLIDNETSDNNTRGFNKWWEAGGIKFVGNGGLQDSRVIGHRSFNNSGDGIWFDWKNKNNIVSHSTAAFNSGFGIHIEASSNFVVSDNFSLHNGQRGIYLPRTSETLVENNFVAYNEQEGIAVIGKDPSDSSTDPLFNAINNSLRRNILIENGSAITLPNPIGSNTSDLNVFIGTNDHVSFSLGWPKLDRLTFDLWKIKSSQDRGSVQLGPTNVPGVTSTVDIGALPQWWWSIRRAGTAKGDETGLSNYDMLVRSSNYETTPLGPRPREGCKNAQIRPAFCSE